MNGSETEICAEVGNAYLDISNLIPHQRPFNPYSFAFSTSSPDPSGHPWKFFEHLSGFVCYQRYMALRVKELRKARGLSQEKLARLAGVSRSQLSEIETERKPANTRRLAAIAAALGVPVEALFATTSPVTTSVDEGHQAEILQLMHKMGSEDLKTLLRIARAMAAESPC